MIQRKSMEQLFDLAVDTIVNDVLNIETTWRDANGLVYGDVPVNTPEEFVMYYLDLRDRGVLDNLRVVSPELAQDFDERFERDALKVMVR